MKVPEHVLNDWKRDRARTIHSIAAVVNMMEDMGAIDMGHLKEREARSFHRITDQLRALVDRMLREIES